MHYDGRQRHLARVLAACLGLIAPASAQANPWDISLRGLGRPDIDPGANLRFRSLSSELALALAPRPMAPAETLGMNGFEFSISNTLADISESADYWQGQPGAPILEGAQRGRQVPASLWTSTLHLRKGLPFSTEIGIQGTYLAFSELFFVGGEAKVALHESFFRWLPAVAARAAFGRLLGSSELDLFTVEADVLASHAFGVGGMMQLTPYIGAGVLFAHVNSFVLDETPYAVTDPVDDQRGGRDGSLYAFATFDWRDNRLPRYFGGLRINVALIEILYEFNIGVLDFRGDKTVSSHTIKLGFDV